MATKVHKTFAIAGSRSSLVFEGADRGSLAMQSTGAKRASPPHPGTETEPQGGAPGTAAGTAPPQQEKRPRPQPVWPGPYKKERSRANPLTIMLSIAALLLAIGGLYWVSSMQEDLARQRN